MSKRNARRTADEWNHIIADFRRSGLSMQAYCKQNQLAMATFSKWKNRLAHPAPEAKQAPSFVPLVRADQTPSQTTSSINLQIGPSITLNISVTGAAHEQ